MQYHLDTIPLWDVMQQRTQCPFCALHLKDEQMEVERALGEKVMEPASRIQVNERGICAEHHRQLLEQNNRLGHALLTGSHCKELLKKLDRLPNLPEKGTGGLSALWGGGASSPMDKLLERLEPLSQGCVICDTISGHMDRYFHTFLHLWRTDAKFKGLWEASPGACLPHTYDLLRSARKRLSASGQQELASSALSLLKASLGQDEKDLEYFTQQFDYRNQGRPWGDSKTALERTARRLRGGFGEEAPGGSQG